MARGHARSAQTGRYISKATAARHPRTTVTESTSGKGDGERLAITMPWVVQQCHPRHRHSVVGHQQANLLIFAAHRGAAVAASPTDGQLGGRPLRCEPGPVTLATAVHARRSSGSVRPGTVLGGIVARQLVRQPARLLQAPRLGLRVVIPCRREGMTTTLLRTSTPDL
jgi:hypothetical protein